MARRRVWIVELSNAADADFAGIMVWTEQNFGQRQADRYANLIQAALDALAADPIAVPSQSRDDDLGDGRRSLHIARPGRHLILYRVVGDRVRVLRILHDSMDVSRHLPSND